MRPLFSIAEMMAVVAVVAIDCWAMRARQPAPTLIFLALGGLPMQIALVVGLLITFRRRRTEKPVPFLVGFEVVGSTCLLSYVVICFVAGRSIDMHLSKMLSPLLKTTGFPVFSMPDWVLRVSLAMFYLTAPQLAAAVLAGWIGHRWWRQTHSERAPSDD
jgi:hypothetical protein